MGHIFIKSSELDFTGYAIYRVVENSAPTVEITRQAFPAPHPERGVTFSPLRAVMHQVQLWESLDGTTLDTLRATIDIDASINNELQVTNFDIVVDRGNPGLVSGDSGDPVAETTDYLDARMKDQNYSVVQRGFGPLRPEDEYLDLSDDVPTGSHGGFRVLPNPFEHEDTFFITIWKATTVIEPAPAGELDVIIVSGDITLDSTHYGKLIIANAGGDLQTLTFPALSAIPDKTRISFSTQYGTYKYLKLQFGGGDSIRFNDGDKNAIYLARAERIDLIFKLGTFCYIVNYEGRARERGKLYGDYMQRVGTVIADGSEYTSAELEGFWDWLTNDAPSNIKCTYAEWMASDVVDGDTVFLRKGLFAVDLVGETFKVPDVSGMFERFLLTGDTERTPNNSGGYQNDMSRFTYRETTGTGGPDQGTILTGVGYAGADPSVDQFRQKLTTAGTETRGKNIAKIPLLIL